MNTPDQSEMLNEILNDDELSRVRAASLAGGLALIRRRRRLRQAAQIGTVSLALLGGLFVLRPHQSPHPVVTPHHAVTPIQSGTQLSPVKSLTDEELFALFPDRAAALIGQPGQQEFVFLNAGEENQVQSW